MAALAKRFVPLADRVLVKKFVPVTKTAGGILLPESSVKSINEGEVVAVGPGATNRDGKVIPVPVKVGQTVLLPEYGGHKISLGDEEFQLFRSEDILGVFEK